MEVEIKIEQSVAKLLREVASHVKGYDVYLGGGYLRDSYCGLPYKDIDIFLVPNGKDKALLPYTPRGYGQSYAKCCEEHEDMRKRGVEALIGLYDRNKAAHEVQYIIYDKPMTIRELSEDMDMTINQVMWNPICNVKEDNMYTCEATEDFVDDHSYGELRFTHWYDKVRMYCRLKRMTEKFPSYSVYEEIELDHYQMRELIDKGEYEYEGSA